MNEQPYREPFDKPQPITSLQMAMITRLALKELGFKPSDFPTTYEAAERLIWALTPSAEGNNTRLAESY